jgi:hypothetical protein
MNGTYRDCPIEKFKEGWMSVVIHNPSTVDLKQAIIAVPNGNFEVVNGYTGEPLQAFVVCHQDYDIEDS